MNDADALLREELARAMDNAPSPDEPMTDDTDDPDDDQWTSF
jgi:hypothetical protein